MEAHKVDRHLDTDCPGTIRPQPAHLQPKPKPFGFSAARNTIPTPVTTQSERLPTLNFSLLNDTKLRKKLNDIGIPAHGTKQAMEKRYKEWAMMWNANCDSNRPKTRQELLRDLDTWEHTQGSLASTSSHSANLGAQIKDKNFDGAGWAVKHSGSFKDLIASAKRSQPAKTQPPAPPPPREEAQVENAELRNNNLDGKPLTILTTTQPETIPFEPSGTMDLT